MRKWNRLDKFNTQPSVTDEGIATPCLVDIPAEFAEFFFDIKNIVKLKIGRSNALLMCQRTRTVGNVQQPSAGRHAAIRQPVQAVAAVLHLEAAGYLLSSRIPAVP